MGWSGEYIMDSILWQNRRRGRSPNSDTRFAISSINNNDVLILIPYSIQTDRSIQMTIFSLYIFDR